MSYRRSAIVTYDVNVNISGLGLVLLAAFGGGCSVHDILVGGGEWGAPVHHEPWLERETGPFGGLLGGAVKLGEEVDIEWQ